MLALFRNDRRFWVRLWTLVLPIMGQNFIQSSLGAVDVFMVGQLNETAVAGLGLADQLFFLLILFLFGVGSGAAIFSAQAWGKQDLPQIHSVMGMSLVLAFVGAVFFAIISLVFPEQIIGLYTPDTAVIAVSASYLRVVGWSYVATAASVVFGSVLRSIEEVRLPLVVSFFSLGLNSVFNYLLIFGKFGFPELGVEGAAIATAGARWAECLILVGLIYRWRLPVAASLRQMAAVTRPFAKLFLLTTLPVIATEIAWSVGQTLYNGFYARIGTESIAAINIAVTIERLAFIVFIAMGSAASVMIGNRLGAGEKDRAMLYAKRFLILQFGLACLLGLFLLSVSGWVPGLYNISAEAASYTTAVLRVMSAAVLIKSANLMAFIGIIRPGGDTRVGLLMDIGPLWLLGVPLAYVGTFILGYSVVWVYALSVVEEVAKLGFALWRIASRRWMKAVV